MKGMILIGVTIGGLVGGWLGSMLDHGNALGTWSMILGTIGSLAGIWMGYKIGQSISD